MTVAAQPSVGRALALLVVCEHLQNFRRFLIPQGHFERFSQSDRTIEFLDETLHIRKTGWAANDENSICARICGELNLTSREVVGRRLNISSVGTLRRGLRTVRGRRRYHVTGLRRCRTRVVFLSVDHLRNRLSHALRIGPDQGNEF